MKRISDRFLQLGVLGAIIGMAMGSVMGATEDFTLAPAHAHMNLLGWASMMIYGLFYRTVPEASASRLATPHFWLATIGFVIFLPSLICKQLGKYLPEANTGLAVGSILTLVSVLLFAAIVFRNTRSGAVKAP
jgi:cbb3-type cytochrome oxidase subunit 1